MLHKMPSDWSLLMELCQVLIVINMLHFKMEVKPNDAPKYSCSKVVPKYVFDLLRSTFDLRITELLKFCIVSKCIISWVNIAICIVSWHGYIVTALFFMPQAQYQVFGTWSYSKIKHIWPCKKVKVIKLNTLYSPSSQHATGPYQVSGPFDYSEEVV